MAVVNTLATALSNAEATPIVFNNSRVTRMPAWLGVGTLEATVADDVGSTYRLVRVPSNARIEEVLLSADAAGATGMVDVGVYQTADNGGLVVDADHFASSVDLGAGAITRVDVTHESAVYGIEDLEKPLWEALGLTEDPFVDYDIAATVTEIHADGGTVSLSVKYGQ